MGPHLVQAECLVAQLQGDRLPAPDDVSWTGFRELGHVAPGGDANLAQVGQTLEGGHQGVGGLAAAELQELELGRKLGEVGHQELVEHLAGDAGGLLRLQVAPAVGRDHPRARRPGRFVAEQGAARAVALVAVVVQREQVLIFLPLAESEVVLRQEGEEPVDGVGVSRHLHVQLLHAHQVHGPVGDAGGILRTDAPHLHGKKARKGLAGQGGLPLAPFPVERDGPLLELAPVGVDVLDGVVGHVAERAAAAVVRARDLELVAVGGDGGDPVDQKPVGDDPVVVDLLVGDKVVQEPGFQAAGLVAFALERGRQVLEVGAVVLDVEREGAGLQPVVQAPFFAALPHRLPVGDFGIAGSQVSEADFVLLSHGFLSSCKRLVIRRAELPRGRMSKVSSRWTRGSSSLRTNGASNPEGRAPASPRSHFHFICAPCPAAGLNPEP